MKSLEWGIMRESAFSDSFTQGRDWIGWDNKFIPTKMSMNWDWHNLAEADSALNAEGKMWKEQIYVPRSNEGQERVQYFISVCHSRTKSKPKGTDIIKLWKNTKTTPTAAGSCCLMWNRNWWMQRKRLHFPLT